MIILSGGMGSLSENHPVCNLPVVFRDAKHRSLALGLEQPGPSLSGWRWGLMESGKRIGR
jgi:hypothetical protein